VMERTDHRDGKWHATVPTNYRPIPVHTLRGVQHHGGMHGRVLRWDGGKWEYEHCPHIHKTTAAAKACAERAAKRWNRTEAAV